MFRTDALDLGRLTMLVRILPLLHVEKSAHQMVNGNDVHEVPGFMLVGFAHFGDGSNTPRLLPTSFLEVQTEPKLTKFLLSLVVQLARQLHVFLDLRGAHLSGFQFSSSQT